jgi:RNA recognition motif-containing protein
MMDDEFTIVRLRGLPWEATEENIVNFFGGLDIVEGGIFIAKTSVGRASGEGFVEFVDSVNAQAGLEKNKEKIAHRYIEIFKSNAEARDMAANIPQMVFDISNSTVDQNSTVIRMRGLPWTTTEKDVKDFFAPVEVSVVHIISDHMERASGQGYVEFSSEEEGEEAMKKHKSDMGGRYIELFKSTPDELSLILARLNPDVQEGSHFVKMRGLPYSASEDEVLEFFGLAEELIKVHFIQDMNGRPSGEAFAEFTTEESATLALEKNRENLGNRYIELFNATVNELKATLRRPANYGRRGWSRRGRNQNSRSTGQPKPVYTKADLDAEMDLYQKKRKVEVAMSTQ